MNEILYMTTNKAYCILLNNARIPVRCRKEGISLEGGVIINMIDENQIKDLKFVTHYFTKDANGKMLLVMAFVLSKQYSDDLSQKVTRGVRNSFAEGKRPRHQVNLPFTKL